VGVEPGRPRLSPRVPDVRVLETEGTNRRLEEGALASDALHEHDAGLRQRDGERQAGKPPSGAEVREAARRPDLRQLDGHKRVGDVDVDAARRVTDRRDGRQLGRHQVEQPLEPLRRPLWKRKALAQVSQARPHRRGHGGHRRRSAARRRAARA
jgi:hypothetical protein